jgi:hypothetical protein
VRAHICYSYHATNTHYWVTYLSQLESRHTQLQFLSILHPRMTSMTNRRKMICLNAYNTAYYVQKWKSGSNMKIKCYYSAFPDRSRLTRDLQ